MDKPELMVILGLTLWAAHGPARAEDLSVAVVTCVEATEETSFRNVARVSFALRQELLKRGRQVINPADQLQGDPIPHPGLLLKATKEYKTAIGAYDGLEFGKARAGLKDALESMREAIRHGSSNEDYVKALHYQAAAALFDNDKDGALKAFVEAISFAPDVQPDSNVFSPDVLKVYQAAKEKTSWAGMLRVQSNPASEVFLNNRPVGITPMEIKDLAPGHYLVRLKSPGYESSAQWIAVEEGGAAEVRMELKEGPELVNHTQTIRAILDELPQERPGPGVNRLKSTLGTDALVLVAKQGDQVQATWMEKGIWVKRYQGPAPEGTEPEYIEKFLASGPPLLDRAGCRSNSECSGGQQCKSGQCVAQPTGKPFYKKWWFWTIVGVVVVGGATAGIVAGTSRSEWTAEVVPGYGL